MNNQLNVSKILLGAFILPWHYRNAFFKALIVPILLIVASEQLMSYLGQHASFKVWVVVALQICVMALFSVTCHRLVLIDPQSVSSAPILRFGRREMRFVYWVITLSLAFLAIVIPWILLMYFASRYSVGESGNLGMYGGISLVAIPASYVIARLAVMFPAIATDREFSLKWIWRLTANNGWRLVVIVVGLPLVFAAVVNLLCREQASLAETVLMSFISSVLTAVEVVAISLAYQELIASKEPCV